MVKRFSFIGDGLSHVAFGAVAIAAVLQITNEMPLVMVITIIGAIARHFDHSFDICFFTVYGH